MNRKLTGIFSVLALSAMSFAQAPATDDWMDGINTPRAILEGCLGSSGIVRQDISMTTRNSF